MKVSKWNTVSVGYWIDAEIEAPGGIVYITLSLSDRTAPWGNTTTLSLQVRTGKCETVWVGLHADPRVSAELRKFAGNTYSTPDEAKHLIGMIASFAAPRDELSQSQREAWDGFVEAVQRGYAVEIGGAA
jgi:hypothetical protein